MGCANCCSQEKDDATRQVIKAINQDLDVLETGATPVGEYHGRDLQELRERLTKLFGKQQTSS